MISMFALSPTWPLSAIGLESEQYSINQDQYCRQSYGIHEDPQTFESAHHLIPSYSYHKQVGLDPHAHVTAPTAAPVIGGGGGDPKMVQKLNHNASERDRRKKMNGLYSSLRSLLPEADQMKKLSIPTTVSRMIKYIPELEQQVVGLIQRKEELLSRISRQVDQNYTHQENQPKGSVAAWSTLSTVSASRVNDREVVIQIPTCEDQKTPVSEILLALEEDGLLLLNASSFEAAFGGRAFYNLHLHEVARSTQSLECETLIK